MDECWKVDARYPARGGKDVNNDIRCHHGWPAHKNSNNSHGCRGWVPGRSARPDDGLDCGFYLRQGGVCISFFAIITANDRPDSVDFNINARWNKYTTWGLDQPSPERVVERRQYRMSAQGTTFNPIPAIMNELRSQRKWSS